MAVFGYPLRCLLGAPLAHQLEALHLCRELLLRLHHLRLGVLSACGGRLVGVEQGVVVVRIGTGFVLAALLIGTVRGQLSRPAAGGGGRLVLRVSGFGLGFRV